ncbi:hypothetical protein AaE_013101 [Aphanomyces astaci]|uniref:SWIM-type domain-containing protein n=1 Tax=Aphanomyces astaci TaxID=112090 RepID=A0A6A4ZBY9_APHAT|nr:hypothetical protein AaE_013101 [Aphanomyces astaci]
MHRDPSSFVFHWDATYKINALAYPVLICGITDPSGKFHPVAFFLIGRESTDEYEWAMKQLMAVYETVVGSCLQLHYVMADAALAPVGALKTLQPQLGIKAILKAILMCFYHCVACVNKRLGVVPTSVKALVARYLFKMHFSRSVGECQLHWNEAKVAWTACDALEGKGFVRYFEGQWVDSPTNNPSELFNKHFKGIYTQRTDHGLCATFQLLGSIAVEYSSFKAQPFALRLLPSKKLQQRFRRLVKNGLLEVVPPHPGIVLRSHEVRIRGVIPELAISMAHAFEDEAEDNALFHDLHRRGITTIPRQALALANVYYYNNAYYYNERANNVRHESLCGVHMQQWYGWHVSTAPSELSCECNYFYKNKYCCHLLYALQNQNKDVQGMPLPPTTFARNVTHSSEATSRFTGRRRHQGVRGAGRNVRRRRTVGPPLAMR